MQVCPYWRQEDLAALEVVTDYREAGSIALAVLQRMPAPAVMVSGPITTGGLGDIAKNRAVLRKSVAHLRRAGRNPFDQTPLGATLERIWRAKRDTGGEGYDYELLEYIYGPIIRLRRIATLILLPGWRTSTGAVWEFEEAKRLSLYYELFSQMAYERICLEVELEFSVTSVG